MGAINQFFRYGLVGLASNVVGYLLYIGLTLLGLGPKLAMTFIYCTSVLQTFLFNKVWTFRRRDSHSSSFLRYCVAYGIGYAVNLLALLLLVDHAGLPHQLVQAAMILIVACMIFLAQKYWVFAERSKSDAP